MGSIRALSLMQLAAFACLLFCVPILVYAQGESASILPTLDELENRIQVVQTTAALSDDEKGKSAAKWSKEKDFSHYLIHQGELIKNSDGSLEIVNTSNAANPMCDGKTPLLTVDVWEHAYYVDYRNARPKYLQEIWSLVNWEFVAANYRRESAHSQGYRAARVLVGLVGASIAAE